MAQQGLSAEAARAKLAREGYNELPRATKRRIWVVIYEVLRQPMYVLLVSGGIVYLLLGDHTEALILMVFASFSVAITIVQESRSEHALEALRNLASPRALVIRDGVQQHIAARELVSDDLVVVTEGDRVPADVLLATAQDLLIDESLLTGESAPVRKSVRSAQGEPERPPTLPLPAGEDSASVFAGTLVVRGTGAGRVQATGTRTEMGRIGRSLNAIETEQPRLQKQMRVLVRNFAIFGVLAGGLIVVLYAMLRGSWLEAALAGIAVGMSLLPEEFPLVLAVFMAMGAWRISQARVLTRRASAIEALGSVTVICTDKTGTLTENRMRLVGVLDDKSRWDEAIAGASSADPVVAENALPDSLTKVLEAGLLASAPQPVDPMDRAIHTLAARWHIAGSSGPDGAPILHAYGLRPDLFAVVNVIAVERGAAAAYAKGAIEAIAQLCRWSDDQLARLQQQADGLAASGVRVLAVARSRSGQFVNQTQFPPSPRDIDFEYLGLLAFADPLRVGVSAAVAEIRSAGVRVVMITGDYPATARAIGQQAGIAATDILTGDQIESMSDEALALQVRTTSLFARIRPNQKLRIVQCLKANGDVVAMTGDGVNDAPAIKAADIGIAMGGRGTDVAREASAIVLLDDDFNSIVKTIRLGRRIYDNLRKAIEYIVAVHIPIAGLALLPLLFGLPLILTPIHIAFLEMVIDPACSVVLEAEAEEDDLMKRPPRNPASPLLLPQRILWAASQGFLVLALLSVILVEASRRGMPEPDLRALVFTSLVAMNVGLILVNRSFSASPMRAFLRPNRSLWILLGAVLTILAISNVWPPAQGLFHFGHLHPDDLAVCAIAGLTCLLLLELLKAVWFGRISAEGRAPV